MVNSRIGRDLVAHGRLVECARETLAVLLFLVCMAAGCVSAPPVQTLTYAVSGKVSINAPADRQVLRFRWQQADGFYDVWLWGALGVGRTHFQGTQEALKITAPQQPIITGPAAQIMQDRLGWALPLDAMGAWLAGAPASSLSMSSSISDAAGRLQQITQADWTITFADHRQVDGQWRPERIVIKGKGLTLDVSIRHPRAVMT